MDNQVAFMKKENYFQQCSFLNIFEVTNDKPSGNIFHSHDYTQIWYVSRGYCLHYIEDQVFTVNSGDAFFVSPMMVHRTKLGPESKVYSLEVDLDAVLPKENDESIVDYRSHLRHMAFASFLENSKDQHSRFIFHLEAGQQVHRLMKDILREYQDQLPCYMDILRLKVLELLLLFVREYQTSPAPSSSDDLYRRYRTMIDQTIQYIDEHYTEHITLQDACKMSSLSRTYFCYLFKLVTQKTFVQYITNLRINAALKLLEDPTIAITTISTTLGFNDSSTFYHIFKKEVGMSPSSYRKQRAQ